MRTVGLIEKVAAAETARVQEPEPAAAETAQAAKGGKRPTKAELLEECAALGIDADPRATNQELADLIEAAKEA